VLDAPLVVLDEPTAHLDDAAADHVYTCVRDALAGRTVVVVTHDRRWEDTDRLVVLDGGQLAEPVVA
jgi:ABC-type transport system involved in cytochrome bd biosynthesis fused ATPase/permease subunit